MSDQTPRLALPYLAASQAQKHVTHNEALKRLDTLVQLVLVSTEATTPPEPAELGDIHALGAAPVLDWAGQDGKLAVREDGGWSFVTPIQGWCAVLRDTGELLCFGAQGWQPVTRVDHNLDGVGIGTVWDGTNRLSVASDAALFTHAGGGHQIKLNKAAAGDTASLLFQSDWTGHAELGLAGDTALSVKTSADGASWHEVLRADPMSETIDLAPAGTARMQLGDTQMQLDVPIVGNAVQSNALDQTHDKLLKVGAFGLGEDETVPNIGGDFTTDLPTGFFRGTGSGGTNYPGGTNYGAHLNIKRFEENLRFSYRMAATRGNAYLSKLDETGAVTEGPYAFLFREDIVGTVSESGGAPTGEIIERGSNANGEYVRFADGTQICTSEVVASVSAGVVWTFPAAFAVDPNFGSLAFAGSAPRIVTVSSIGAGSVTINCWDTSGARQANDTHCIAIGRWS